MDGVIIADARGVITGMNAAAARIFECEPSAIIGRDIAALVPTFVVTDVEMQRQMTSADRTAGVRHEAVGLRASGETFPLSFALGEGRLENGEVFLTCTVRAISEVPRRRTTLRTRAGADATGDALRLEAERIAEEARATAARLAAVLDVTVGGVIITDARGLVTEMNSAASRIFGYDADEIVGQSITALMPGPYLDELQLDQTREVIDQLVIGIRREVVGHRRGGRAVPRELPLGKGRLSDGDLFFAGVVQDISDRKRVESGLRDDNAELRFSNTGLRENNTDLIAANDVLTESNQRELTARGVADDANQAKSDFLSQMSHELRTPLNAILGFSELLRERASSRLVARELQYLQHVTDAGTHLLGLINDILDLSRVEAGRMEFHAETLPLARLLEPVLASAGLLAGAQSLDFRVDTGTDIVVWVDAGRVRQILLNLLSNAVKFTPAGGHVALQISAEGSDLLIVVSDTGIGIPLERQDRVFGTFERVNEDRATAGGSGIGLSLTKRLVEMQLGTISFESTEGTGSTFRVRLPDAVMGKVAGRRLLLLEDEAASARLICEYAAAVGLECEVVTTVAQALASARGDRPLGIVVDLVLVGERGEDLIEALKADPTLADIRVLVTSVEDDTGRSRALGADGHLTKPVRRDWFEAWMNDVAMIPAPERRESDATAAQWLDRRRSSATAAS